MRKKSHISLARHILNVSDVPSFKKHKKAFYVGSVMPDIKPSFFAKRHEMNETFARVEKRIYQLTKGYRSFDELSTMYFVKLGEVVHYIADYFTYPHNEEYTGTMTQHCIYEGELKHKLREYIRDFDAQKHASWKKQLELEHMGRFRSVADILKFIKEEHRKYIRKGNHSVEVDCKYIMDVCSKVTMAILHVGGLTTRGKKVYATVRRS